MKFRSEGTMKKYLGWLTFFAVIMLGLASLAQFDKRAFMAISLVEPILLLSIYSTILSSQRRPALLAMITVIVCGDIPIAYSTLFG